MVDEVVGRLPNPRPRLQLSRVREFRPGPPASGLCKRTGGGRLRLDICPPKIIKYELIQKLCICMCEREIERERERGRENKVGEERKGRLS